jgi:hypothetical protein
LRFIFPGSVKNFARHFAMDFARDFVTDVVTEFAGEFAGDFVRGFVVEFVRGGICGFAENFVVETIEFGAGDFEKVWEPAFVGGRVAIGTFDFVICARDGVENEFGGVGEGDEFTGRVAACEAEGEDASHDSINAHDGSETASLANGLEGERAGFGAAELLELAIVLDAETGAGAARGAAATATADEDEAASEVIAGRVIGAMAVLRCGDGIVRSG